MKPFTEGIYSPANIEVLLWCHTRCNSVPNADAPAIKEALQRFLEVGAIVPDEKIDNYSTTPLGKAWVEALCKVPPPEMVFMDQRGCILEQRP